MTVRTKATERGGAYVRANDLDIHYVEAGTGEPLVLLHGGFASTGPVWSGHPAGYVDHMPRARRALPGDRARHARRRCDRCR